MAKNLKPTPKSLIDEVLLSEALNMRDDEPYLADVLLDLGLITTSLSYTTESDAFSWIESEPSLKEKLLVLKHMGYDLSILNIA